LKYFPNNKDEAKELETYVNTDMNLKYFLEDQDLEIFLEKYKKQEIEHVFRNCDWLKDTADRKLNNYFTIYFETINNLIMSNIKAI